MFFIKGVKKPQKVIKENLKSEIKRRISYFKSKDNAKCITIMR